MKPAFCILKLSVIFLVNSSFAKTGIDSHYLANIFTIRKVNFFFCFLTKISIIFYTFIFHLIFATVSQWKVTVANYLKLEVIFLFSIVVITRKAGHRRNYTLSITQCHFAFCKCFLGWNTYFNSDVKLKSLGSLTKC